MNKQILLSSQDVSKFWERVSKSSPEKCWEWTGCYSRKYGRLMLQKNGWVSAHRISYELFFGKIPIGQGQHGVCVLHKCDNPKCVNPHHLFLGSNLDNIKDMKNKGRVSRGDSHINAKLTCADIPEIRRLSRAGKSCKYIGKMFGVSGVSIWGVRSGRTWSHVQ